MSELLPAEQLLLPGEADLLSSAGGSLRRGGRGPAGDGQHRGEAGGDGADLEPQFEVGDVVATSEYKSLSFFGSLLISRVLV